MNVKLLLATAVLAVTCRPVHAAPPDSPGDKRIPLHLDQVGRLHDAVLEDLMGMDLPRGQGLTREGLATAVRAAAASTWSHADVDAFAADAGMDRAQADRWLSTTINGSVDRLLALIEVSGGFVGGQGVTPVLGPVIPAMEGVLEELARTGAVSADFARELPAMRADWEARGLSSEACLRDARMRLAIYAEGDERTAADAYLTVFESSARYWQRGSGAGGSHVQMSDSEADATGAAIGSIIGAIGSAIAGGPVGAGAAAGGAIGGAIASDLQHVDPTPKPADPPSQGGSGSSGGSGGSGPSGGSGC